MAAELTLSHVRPEDAVDIWRSMERPIRAGLRRGQGDQTTFEHMLGGILQRKSQLWAVHDGSDIHAVVVVSAPVHATMTKVFVQLIAGHGLDRWADLVEARLEELRELVEADLIEASCRPGLARYLQRRGWKQKAIVMERK